VAGWCDGDRAGAAWVVVSAPSWPTIARARYLCTVIDIGALPLRMRSRRAITPGTVSL
jgi:hypothetical protein